MSVPGPGQSKSKGKPALGITAGAEDVKYHAKYKELKKKVKEIEADNDILHFKVLQAKRNIQRMKLERAILYERLSAGPGSPADERPPASRAGDLPNELMDGPPGSYGEYTSSSSSRNRDNGRSSHSKDPAIMGNVPQPAKRGGGGPHEIRHNLPSFPQLPPVHSLEQRQSSSSSSRGGRSNQQQQPPPPGPYHHHHQSVSPYTHGEPLPPPGAGSVFHHSPTQRRPPEIIDLDVRSQHQSPIAPLSPRPRSSDSRSTATTNTGRIHNHQRLGPGTYINRDDERERERELLELDWQQQQQHLREREQRERDVVRRGGGRNSELSSTLASPPFAHRQRHEYQDHHPTSRMRDEPGYYRDVPSGDGGSGRASTNEYPRLSRSETPGSGSGASGGPSRPSSRGGGGSYYDNHEQQQQQQQQRSYRLRPVLGGRDVDGLDAPDYRDIHHDDSLSSRSQSLSRGDRGGFAAPPQSETRSTVQLAESSSSTRKRHRGLRSGDLDMDLDDGEPSVFSSRLSDDRGAKRYHRDHQMED